MAAPLSPLTTDRTRYIMLATSWVGAHGKRE